MDKTELSHWFPLIEAAGLPVPKTKIVKMPQAAIEEMWGLFDGKDDCPELVKFAETVALAGDEFGYPLFLRTDLTSCKHSWERSCFIADRAKLSHHIYQICEESECMDFMGMKWDTFVLRELLPTIPLSVCPLYGNMPVCREFRFFVTDGEVKCWHPYWPRESLEQGGCDASVDLCHELSAPPQLEKLYDLAKHAGLAVGGSWSIDILETTRGWYVTDMAEAYKSFHWEDCEFKNFFRHLPTQEGVDAG